MRLRVKAGREYVLGGRVYKGGDLVDVPDKHVKVLTLPKAPLEREDSPKVVDLPKPPEAPVPQSSGRQYLRRDMTAEDGRTGAETSLQSRPRGRPRLDQTSNSSEDEDE
jgi:hypothetical protein